MKSTATNATDYANYHNVPELQPPNVVVGLGKHRNHFHNRISAIAMMLTRKQQVAALSPTIGRPRRGRRPKTNTKTTRSHKLAANFPKSNNPIRDTMDQQDCRPRQQQWSSTTKTHRPQQCDTPINFSQSRKKTKTRSKVFNFYLSFHYLVLVISLLSTASHIFVIDCLRSRFGSFTVISAKPCQNALGQTGTCMFMWDCIKSEGLHLGTCSDRFLFGSCCYHNTTSNDVDIQRPNVSNTTTTLPMMLGDGQQVQNATTTSSSLSTVTSFLQSAPSWSSDDIGGHQRPQSEPSNSLTSNASGGWHSGSSHGSHHHENISDADTVSTWPFSSEAMQHHSVISSATSTTTSTTTTTTTTSTTTTPAPPITSPPFASPTTYQSSEQTVNTMSLPTVPPNPSYNMRPSSFQEHPAVFMSSPIPPQRPQGSSWLSRPINLLAQSIFSFKPFPYLNPNKQRPNYRPQAIPGGGYRPPPHYRPAQVQRPASVQHSAATGEIVSSPSEINSLATNTSTNKMAAFFQPNKGPIEQLMLNNSSSAYPASADNNNNDHHIVNPNHMSDRLRPIDKQGSGHSQQQQYADESMLEGLNQKQNHYIILDNDPNGHRSNTTTLEPPSNHFAVPCTPSYPYNSSVSLATGNPNSEDTMSLAVTSSQSASGGSMQAALSLPPALEQATNSSNNFGQQQQLAPFDHFGQHTKPAVGFMYQQQSHQGNDSSFPSYPLISSSQQQQQPQYPPLSPIDEIHGLSTMTIPTANQSTTALVAPPTMQTNPSSQNFAQYQGIGGNNNHGDSTLPYPGRPEITAQDSGIGQVFGVSTTVGGGSSTNNLSTQGYTTLPTNIQPTFGQDHSSGVSYSLAPTTAQQPPKMTTTLHAYLDGVKKNPAKEVACGVTPSYPQTKVVGGKNAPFGAWPWQVSVRKVSFFGFSSTHRCGGAVISSEWIATAGHCVEDLALQSIRIRVGEYDFSAQNEPFPFIERAARRKVVHPKYNFYTYENDLALVQLDEPIKFPPHVAPICLPPDNIDLLGRNATVTGWGRLNEGGTLPTILQEVRVPIVSNDKCKDMFLSAGRPEYIPDIFLCAGYEEGGRDSCQGDSGGPLQVKGDDGKWFLAGIISWGIGCAEQNLPGVCTRISKFKLWIQSTMNSNT